MWDRLHPTGEYAALLVEGDRAGGIIMRPNKKHGTWEYEVDQLVNSWGYLDAVSAASREASSFEVRFVPAWSNGTTLRALSWAVFRFPSGVVKAGSLSYGPPESPSINGVPLAGGVLYPQSYVMSPFQVPQAQPSFPNATNY